MQIVEIIEGSDKGSFLVQERKAKEVWKTIYKSQTKLGAELEYKQRICPIIDNRLVDSQTFAIRFKHFLEDIQVCDACGEEELEYMNAVADKLLQYQKLTVIPNSDEERYLKNNKIL